MHDKGQSLEVLEEGDNEQALHRGVKPITQRRIQVGDMSVLLVLYTQAAGKIQGHGFYLDITHDRLTRSPVFEQIIDIWTDM